MQILTTHERNGGKLLPRGRAKVNSMPGLNFTKGEIIFYPSPRIKNWIFVICTPFIDFGVCTEHGERLSRSKFRSCYSFYDSQGNSRNRHTGLDSKHGWTLSKVIHVMWPLSGDLNLWMVCIICSISYVWKSMSIL